MMGLVPLLAALFVGAPQAEATEIGYSNNVGLGLVFGNPTGLTGKVYFDGPVHAIDAAVATQLFGFGQDRTTAHVVYLNHPGVLLAGSVAQLPWHVGVGPQIWSGSLSDDDFFEDMAFGVRVPVGLDLNFRQAPVQISGDVAAVVPIVPSPTLGLDLNVSVRYFF